MINMSKLALVVAIDATKVTFTTVRASVVINPVGTLTSAQ
jgi:hypothetical protein